jgi:hypothetical protein
MSKRDQAPGVSSSEQPPAAGTIPLWAKAALSALLLGHLTAVVVAPLAVACDTGASSSPAVSPLRSLLDPYISLMFLNHGYFFFAPDPGPNHLVDYKVEFDDGRQPVTGRFPNLATERPRLLYHRHFMLSESLYGAFAPPTAPPEPSPPPLTAPDEEHKRHELDKEAHARMLVAWRQRRAEYEAMQHSIEEHLKAVYGGQRVTLTRVEHRPPMPAEVTVLHKRLDAPDLYTNLPENPGARR